MPGLRDQAPKVYAGIIRPPYMDRETVPLFVGTVFFDSEVYGFYPLIHAIAPI